MERSKLIETEKVAEAMEELLDEKRQMKQTQMKSVQNGGQYEIQY